MRYSNYFIFLLLAMFSCSGNNDSNRKVRILNLELIELNEPNKIFDWDTIDGPDLFITISINDKVRFTSNKMENPNIINPPVTFKIDSNIVFQSISDQIKLNLYDKDDGNDQLILKDFNFNPALFEESPYYEVITCAVCFATFKITYGIAD